MKILKNISLFAMLVFAMVACVEKTPDYGNFPTKDVDFTYNVDGNEYTLDFYVVSTIQFNNTSSKSGAVTWDFGDGTTSKEANPKHKYAAAGKYEVKLTVDGVGSRTYPLLIYDITPVLRVTGQSAETLISNDGNISLGIELPNPENLVCKYVWKFPEGTMKADGTEITEFEGYSHEDGTIDNPGELKFRNVGSQRIELQTWFDVNGENRRLDNSYVNVQVGYDKEVPTIYYATIGGNIKAYKLIPHDQLPEGTKNLPFDLGVSSGNMPLQLVFKTVTDEHGIEGDFLYLLAAGKQYPYINDEAGTNGDGKITVMSADGTYANVMVTNVGRTAFNDPFEGCADNTYLYYTDRNTGVRQIKLTARGEVEQSVYSTEVGYLVTNQQLGYYGNGISYGAIHTDLLLDSKGVFYMAKNYSGNGIYRFTTADIGKLGQSPHPILLSGCAPRSMAIDEVRKQMYVWFSSGITPGVGFVQYPLVGLDESLSMKDYTKYVKMEADPINATENEGVFTSQMALDEETGNVYFGFRAASGFTAYTTGLYYYDYAAGRVVNYEGNNDKILGIAINPRKTYLF